MSHINRLDWTADVLAERLGVRDESPDAVTVAELYLAAGKIVWRGIRRGYRAEAISRVLGLSLVDGLCALCYAESSPSLILQALVEDWSWEQIKASLGKRLNSGDLVPRHA